MAEATCRQDVVAVLSVDHREFLDLVEQVFHKLVGPGVGLVDRLRDRLTGRTT